MCALDLDFYMRVPYWVQHLIMQTDQCKQYVLRFSTLKGYAKMTSSLTGMEEIVYLYDLWG